MTRKVAIVGYSLRFPGTDRSRFWQDLVTGRNLVTEVDEERWAKDVYGHPRKSHPGTSYTFAAGSLGDVSGFDAAFFGISPREAALMDPQQRLLLEMSWECLENSGIRPSRLRGSRSGVYVGIASADYAYRLADDMAVADSMMATGNTASIAANRISYVLDLRGPSMAIDTACSSALVAFHQACRAIATGEVEQAFAGGINLHLHPYGFIVFAKAGMLSPRGRCNVFDAAADGYVRTEGGGLFFLKDFARARSDGDPILAVVAASAVNTDGRKSGLTVPNVDAQSALLQEIYCAAGIDPAAIDYLEAHGTGTAVGDPIETRAIAEALALLRPKDQPLPIGSVKSNLGHLETASGVAGLVKALHCLEHRRVPPTIGVAHINPEIRCADWNLKLVTEELLLRKRGKLVIGVNSFGFGGANAHVILESPPAKGAKPEMVATGSLPPLIFTGGSEAALQASARALAERIAAQPASGYYAIAYNAAFRRDWHEQRGMAWGSSAREIAAALTRFADAVSPPAGVETIAAVAKANGPAFVYSGNGAQWSGMGRRLLNEEAIVLEAVREVDALFAPRAGFSLLQLFEATTDEDGLASTALAQPALFALQVGMTRLLAARGIRPAVVVGHSVGEIAAAWAAGALSLTDAVEVVHQRSRLQETTRGRGQMTAAAIGQELAESLFAELDLARDLVLAGINGPGAVTVAGSRAHLAAFEAALGERQLRYKRLDLDYAFHSPAMDGIEADLRQTLASLSPTASAVPFYSTVSGTLLPGDRLDAGYWWQNVRQPVRFAAAVDAIIERDLNVFVEIGPQPILRSYLLECFKARDRAGQVFITGSREDDGAQRLLTSSSQLLLSGATVDWSVWFPHTAPFVELPNYPWQRERHWHPLSSAAMGLVHRHKEHPLLGYRLRQHILTWENQLDVQLNPTLADHVVGEAVVFPGAGFAELALAAAASSGDVSSGVIEIEDLEIRTPLLLSHERSATVRTAIDPQDGRLTIVSREQLSEDPWTPHVVARIVPDPQPALLRPLRCPALPDRPPDFTSSSHAALTQSVGIHYGPAFQCLECGWIAADTALAVLRTPAPVINELAHTILHPALLDNAFQLVFEVLREAVAQYEAVAFVPTRIGRIVLDRGCSPPVIAQASVLRGNVRSLHAEFILFAADGSAVAVIKEVCFRAIRLGQGGAEHLRFLACHLTPSPLCSAPPLPPAIEFAALQTAMHDLVQRAAVSGTHRRYSAEVDPLLDILCSRHTQVALRALANDGESLSADRVSFLAVTCPECEPYLANLIERAEDDGSLQANADGWVLLPGQQDQSSALDIWNSLLAEDPDYFQVVHSVGRVGLYLPRLLSGEMSLMALCPQESSLSSLLRIVLGPRARQRICQALRLLIAQGLTSLPRGQRLGVLEMGAGDPTFAMDLGFALDFNCTDYTFASSAVQTSDEAFCRLLDLFPAMRVGRIDGSTELSDASLPVLPASCALVILTLDFAELETAHQSLAIAQRCLAGDGSLLVIGQHPSRWVDFVFGARRANWLRREDGRWSSSQRPASYWEETLRQAGFECSRLLEFSPDTLSGPYLLLGRLNETAGTRLAAETSLRRWLLLADGAGFSAQLSDQMTTTLQTNGDLVIQTSLASSEPLASLLREALANFGGIDGLVLLTGLSLPAEQVTPDGILDSQVNRCAAAAALLQACAAANLRSTCWLITRGVRESLFPSADQDDPGQEAFCPDAALWGFGRSMQNEGSGGTVHLLDIARGIGSDVAAQLLCRELAAPDAEDEVFLDGDGARHAARFRLEPGPDTRAQVAIAAPTVSLGFQFSGQLRNLRWEASPGRELAEGEVEVEVQATGLNFRDVMYALGLLPDEAIDNGFAGATLGFEFAGIVRRSCAVGCEFNIGDKVVGFGPSSFGNRVITQGRAIAHIPPDISFEAAATIPSAFFTVYYALHHLARLQPGEKVLIHGAAGGVGIAAIQVARWLGAEIFATAGTGEKRDFLHLLGVGHVFDSRSLAFADDVLESTDGRGVDVVLNSLAGEAINRNLRVLRPFGRFLELGKRDYYDNTRLGLRPFRNNISYFGIDADQLMMVQPQLAQRLFHELIDLFTEGELHPLPYRHFEAEEVVDAFRYMQQAKQIGKVVLTYRQGIHRVFWPASGQRRRLHLSADATYLVTGGLRGFGLRSAEWLVEKGARHLILISRSGADTAEARVVIERLAAQGVNLHVAACDVTCRDALAALLAETRHTLPPLKGILHAAAVIDDRLVRDIQTEQIRQVLAPKVLGAYHLHELTRAEPLDLFVLFSSATAVFGNPGQASYVAANTALEALAAQRRANGLCATAIALGPIADTGFLARHQKTREALEKRMGGSALAAHMALDVLEDLLMTDRSGIAVLDFGWAAISRSLPSAASPKFRELAWHAEDGDREEDLSADLQRLLLELPDSELREAIAEMLKVEIGEILRIAPDKIDPGRSLYDIGFDSLMGVELAVALERRFSIRLPVMALSQGPTIAKLAERLVQQLRHGGEGERATADLAAQAAEVARQQGVAVSEEVIAAFATELQAQQQPVEAGEDTSSVP